MIERIQYSLATIAAIPLCFNFAIFYSANFQVHMPINIRKLVCLDAELLMLYGIMNVQKTFID